MNLKERLENELNLEVMELQNKNVWLCRYDNRLLVISYEYDEDFEGNLYNIYFDKNRTINGFCEIKHLLEALHNYFRK